MLREQWLASGLRLAKSWRFALRNTENLRQSGNAPEQRAGHHTILSTLDAIRGELLSVTVQLRLLRAASEFISSLLYGFGSHAAD